MQVIVEEPNIRPHLSKRYNKLFLSGKENTEKNQSERVNG